MDIIWSGGCRPHRILSQAEHSMEVILKPLIHTAKNNWNNNYNPYFTVQYRAAAVERLENDLDQQEKGNVGGEMQPCLKFP